MTRIAFVSTFPPEPLMSGFAMRIRGILDSLPGDIDILKIYPRAKEARLYPPDVSFDTAGVSRLREVFSPVPRIIMPYANSSDREEVIRRIRDFRPDGVVVSGIHVFPFAPRVAGVIYDSHNVEWHLSEGLLRNGGGGLHVKLHRYITAMKLRAWEKRLVKGSMGVVACSKTDADYFSSLRGKPVPVVYNGTDTDYWKVCREPERGLILFCGDMSYQPNIEAAEFTVLRVIPILKTRGWRGKLVICGRDPAPEVRALEGPDVEVTGTVEDVRSFYRRAEVMVAPMQTGSGTPLKVITGMAAGLPVVTTSRVADSLGIRGEDALLQADSPRETAEALMRILGSPELAEALSRRSGREARERFSWSVVGKRFWEVVRGFI